MAKDEPRISKLGARLIQILESGHGDWLSRSEIGLHLGRRLQPYDMDLLNQLAKDGLIEKREAIVGQVKTRWEYRVPVGS